MYKISNTKLKDIPELICMWRNQYLRYINNEVMSDFLSDGEDSIVLYLEQQINQGNAIVAKNEDAIVGYIAWMYFDFHNEKSAFCPIIGHASIEEDSQAIYHEMYNYAAQKWVDNNRFNHLWMIFNDNYILKNMLYDIGFGSHVIDAYAKVQKPVNQSNNKYIISKATYSDAELLLNLVTESVNYYIDSPIFLKRGTYELDDIFDIIQTDNLFVVWDKEVPIGLMNLSVQKGYNIENLACTNTGLISKVGAYIKPEYRGMGIGKCLLSEIMNQCIQYNVQYIHVSFETVNPFANIFWRKYFEPMILSVRRTVNKDINNVK